MRKSLQEIFLQKFKGRKNCVLVKNFSQDKIIKKIGIDNMQEIFVETERGTILNGVLFSEKKSDSVLIAITGIHGNFYSNPFYFNIGETLSKNGIDFIYAQTNDAFGEIETFNTKTNSKELVGSWNERFFYTEDDISAYLKFAEKNYKNIFLAGHSLGANKVIYFLSKNPDAKINNFLLMSPADIKYMMSGVTDNEKKIIKKFVDYGQGEKILPFEFMGWVRCTANTANDWLSGIFDNVREDFSQVEKIVHAGGVVDWDLRYFHTRRSEKLFRKHQQTFSPA